MEWPAIAANPHFQRWGKIKDRLQEFVDANRNKLADISVGLLSSERASCLETLVQIPGISDKYARNLMMDAGHPAFMDSSFAFDSRLAAFLIAVTRTSHTYSLRSATKWTEADLLTIAHPVGLSGWEMDRLIFGYWAELVGPWVIPFKAQVPEVSN